MEIPNEETSNILDWNELSESDQARAEELLRELNQIFDKYYLHNKKDKILDA